MTNCVMAERPLAAVLCAGSAGDLVPYLALAQKIQEKGNGRVLIVTNSPHRMLVEEKGLLWADLGPDPGKHMLDTGKMPDMKPMIQSWLRNSVKACQELRPRGVVFSTITHLACSSLCEALGLRYVVTHLGPMAPTGEHGPPVFGTGEVWFAWSARLKWRLFELMAFRMHKQPVHEVRIELGLGPQKQTASEEARRQRVPQIMGYSAALCPKPADVPDHVHITGQWVDTEQESQASQQLPEPVARFLDEAERSGKDVVFVTFGSLLGLCRDASQFGGLMGALSSAIVAAGACALLATKGCEHLEIPAALSKLQEDGQVLLAPGFLPHGSIMSRCLAVICHGGSGTVHTALRAAAVVIVVPGKETLIDQPFWAGRVAGCGVGYGPVYRSMRHVKSSTALLQVLRELLANRELVKAAVSAMARYMRSEGGAAEAAEIALRHFSES